MRKVKYYFTKTLREKSCSTNGKVFYCRRSSPAACRDIGSAPFPPLSRTPQMKKLLLTVLAGLSLAAVATQRAHAGSGDPCVDGQGRSGYIIATGRSEYCNTSGE
jgi:hypothetical protein